MIIENASVSSVNGHDAWIGNKNVKERNEMKRIKKSIILTGLLFCAFFLIGLLGCGKSTPAEPVELDSEKNLTPITQQEAHQLTRDQFKFEMAYVSEDGFGEWTEKYVEGFSVAPAAVSSAQITGGDVDYFRFAESSAAIAYLDGIAHGIDAASFELTRQTGKNWERFTACGPEYERYDVLRVDSTLLICAAYGWGGQESTERFEYIMEAFIAASAREKQAVSDTGACPDTKAPVMDSASASAERSSGSQNHSPASDGYLRVENDYFSYEIPIAAVDGKVYRQMPFTDRDYYLIPLEESTGTHDPYTIMIIYDPAKIANLYEVNVSGMTPSSLAAIEYNKWIRSGYKDGTELVTYTLSIDGQAASVVELNNTSKQIFYFFNTPSSAPIFVQMTADAEYCDAIKDHFVQSVRFK